MSIPKITCLGATTPGKDPEELGFLDAHMAKGVTPAAGITGGPEIKAERPKEEMSCNTGKLCPRGDTKAQ